MSILAEPILEIGHLDFFPTCQNCTAPAVYIAEVTPKHGCLADHWKGLMCEDHMEDWHECRFCNLVQIKYIGEKI